jgi:hypothetical protein
MKTHPGNMCTHVLAFWKRQPRKSMNQQERAEAAAKVMIDTPEQAFAEYEFTEQSSKTGRTIHELIFGRLVAANGRIKLLRESINLVEVALGVFPNGLRDGAS